MTTSIQKYQSEKGTIESIGMAKNWKKAIFQEANFCFRKENFPGVSVLGVIYFLGGIVFIERFASPPFTIPFNDTFV